MKPAAEGAKRRLTGARLPLTHSGLGNASAGGEFWSAVGIRFKRRARREGLAFMAGNL